jgi:hypothetical protein
VFSSSDFLWSKSLVVALWSLGGSERLRRGVLSGRDDDDDVLLLLEACERRSDW